MVPSSSIHLNALVTFGAGSGGVTVAQGQRGLCTHPVSTSPSSSMGAWSETFPCLCMQMVPNANGVDAPPHADVVNGLRIIFVGISDFVTALRGSARRQFVKYNDPGDNALLLPARKCRDAP